jgi:purine-binding chemotaxis protein CheW
MSASQLQRDDSRQTQTGGLCAFWIAERCFGIDIALVGGVVTAERVIPVPRAPAPVMGLFNLRGQALALVDIAGVLELPRPDLSLDRPRSALVIRAQGVHAAALIDKPEGVFMRSRGEFHPSEAAHEHPAVRGVFRIDVRGGLAVTVLDTEAVVSRLKQLSFREGPQRVQRSPRGDQ